MLPCAAPAFLILILIIILILFLNGTNAQP
jgi:hypothetical protein